MRLKSILLVILFSSFLTYAQDLTIPPKNYVDSVNIEGVVKRQNNKFPLSDQGNSKQWTLLKKYSDEFDSKKLNTQKWYPNNPKWKGRPPTYFHGSNVSPEVKLMDAPWVSGFWMTNVGKDWWTEIDICENAPGLYYNRHDLNSNIHVFRAPKDKGNVKKHFSRTKKYYFPEELQLDYHVWGLEWTPEYIRFYIDGILFREAKNTHWHQPLEVNFNCESNKWFGALPDDNRLDGEYHVKYFRAWKLAN